MIKVWGLSKWIWLLIVLALLICSFGFLVGAMDYDEWFSQRLQVSGSTIEHHKGALLHPKDKSDSYKHYSDDCHDDYIGSGWCDQLESFYSGGVAYVFFDTIASILVVIISIMVVLDLLKVKILRKIINLYVSSILLFVVTFLHFLSYVVWAGTVNLRFDNCSFNIPFHIRHEVCGEGGAAFGLFIIFFLVIFAVFYFILVRTICIEEESENEQGSYEAAGNKH